MRLDGQSPGLGSKGYPLFVVTMLEVAMRRIALAVALSSLALGSAMAADQSCKAQADAKKLAGAALTSFMKKCETDAQATCDAQAADKKLSGAAKDSFTKKCVRDATGT
jgi:hypothetical protein